ncbi:hypothetical protein OG792_05140 [Micromonospora sp. NBC_01699]|uniref:hypothetical protein n=1 Tax=Micromonospora sp. NBC_01699 TaxID=2975984 RepID=UPI002E321252|nr:hypothetical protein [Micromonospora sp. NBC_01699]
MIRTPVRLVPTLIALVAGVTLAVAGAVTAPGPDLDLAGTPIGACATCFTDPNERPPVPGPDRPVAP